MGKSWKDDITIGCSYDTRIGCSNDLRIPGSYTLSILFSADLGRIGPFFSAKVWRNGYFVVFLQPK